MKPIIFFDLETTGVEVETARIVQIACLKVNADLSPIEGETPRMLYINPGIPIPAEATAVHGITDDLVKNAHPFGRYANAFIEYFKGCDLATFNGNRFDIPLMAEEFARLNMEFPAAGTLMIDVWQIFANKEPRDLTGAVRFYLNSELTGAHSAVVDIMATLDVLVAQRAKYEDVGAMDTLALHQFCEGEHPRVDLAGKIVLIDGVACYGFGKDKGKPVKANPGFAYWMLKQSFPTNTKNILKKIVYGK